MFFSINNNVNSILSKNTKKSFKKKALERYQNLSEEEKNKEQEYGQEPYKDFSEEKKMPVLT